MAMAENIGLVVQVQSSPVISPNTLNVVEFTVDDIKEEKKFVFKDPTFQQRGHFVIPVDTTFRKLSIECDKGYHIDCISKESEIDLKDPVFVCKVCVDLGEDLMKKFNIK